MASSAALKLLEQFLEYHPLVKFPSKDQPLTRVTTEDLDTFWQAHFPHALTDEQLSNKDSRARVRGTVNARNGRDVGRVGLSCLRMLRRFPGKPLRFAP